MTAAERQLFFRVDADAENGTGHFMRCLSLAQHWLQHYGPASFAGRFPSALNRRLEQETISSFPISAAHPDPRDIEESLALLDRNALVVVDGYHFDSSYHDAVTAAGHRLAVIDDTAHLDRYGGQLLLNQNVYADELDYREAPAGRLLGLRYALLSREFRSYADKRSAASGGAARNLLVTMGGADPGNDTMSVLKAIANADRVFDIRVVAGAANRHVDEIRDFCESQSGDYELAVDTMDMPAMMDWADLAIAAAGTTSWELLYMGVPTVFIAIASNQEPIGTGIDKRGAGKYLGHRRSLDWSLVAETLLALAADDSERRSLADAGRNLVDGEGVVRVAEELKSLEEG